MPDEPMDPRKLEAELAKARVKAFWDQYQYYNSSLRGWLLAFGAGLLGLMITQASAFTGMSEQQKRVFVAILAVGTVLQVVAALMNKYYNLAAFHLAQSPQVPTTQDSAFLKFGPSPSRDLVVDLVTVTLFIIATIWLAAIALK